MYRSLAHVFILFFLISFTITAEAQPNKGSCVVKATDYKGVPSITNTTQKVMLIFITGANGSWRFDPTQQYFGAYGIGIPADSSFRVYGTTNGARYQMGCLCFQVDSSNAARGFNVEVTSHQQTLYPGQSLYFFINDSKDPKHYANNSGSLIVNYEYIFIK